MTLIAGGDKVAGKDPDLAIALARPPAVVAGDLVVLGQHLDHVALVQRQLVLALAGVVVDGEPHVVLGQRVVVVGRQLSGADGIGLCRHGRTPMKQGGAAGVGRERPGSGRNRSVS